MRKSATPDRKRCQGPRLFLRSRGTKTIVASGLIAVIVTRLLISAIAEVRLEDAKPARFVSMLELLTFAFALLCVLGIAPRFPEWERLGVSRYRYYVAATATCALLLPQAVLFASISALPPRSPTGQWLWIAVNLLIHGAFALLLASVLGHTLGVLVSATVFAGMLVVQNKFGPVLSWLPLASGSDPRPRWPVAAGLAIAALLVYPLRAGSPVLEAARRRNEE